MSIITWAIALPVIVCVAVLVIAPLVALASKGCGRTVLAAVLLAMALSAFLMVVAVGFVRHNRHATLWSPVVVPIEQHYQIATRLEHSSSIEQPGTILATIAAADELADTASSAEPVAEEETSKDESAAAEKPKSEQPSSDDDRPSWVDAKPFKDGGVYKVPVTVGPWPTSEDAIKLLPAAVDKEIAKYAAARTHGIAATKLRLPRDYVMSHMIKNDVWEESVKIDSFDDVKHMVGRDVWENSENAADGEWTRLHVLVKFDDDVNRRLDDGWARLERVERLTAAGVLGAIALILLGAVYAYLKIDLKTGGAYRGRLRAGALAAILAVIVLVLLNRARTTHQPEPDLPTTTSGYQEV